MAHRTDGNNTKSFFQDLAPCPKELNTRAFDVPKSARRDTYLLITYLLTYLLTLWSRILSEKLTGSQLVKKFPAFYVTRRFITIFTSACHLSLS